MLKRTRLSLAVSAAVGVGFVGLAPQVFAQAAPAQQLDRVEVTGSLIKRSQTETALPVTTITVDELQKAGVTTAQDALSFIAENQAAQNSTSSVSGVNGGASYADLRGLGPSRTLVLLNGQRIVNNPYSAQAVDLNTIPTVAIQRIEVLRDGASAVYGTDAIAGVINIITRKEYQGISVGAQGTWPTQSGGDAYAFSILGGIGNLTSQGWNVYGGFNYNKQNVLTSTQRSFAETGYIPSKGVLKTSGTTFPGNYTGVPIDDTLSSSANPTAPGCNPVGGSINPAGSTRSCRFDYTRYIDLIGEQEQWSGLVRGSLALGSSNTLSLEYFRSYNQVQTNVAPTPLTQMRMTPNNPYFPGNGTTPVTNTNVDLTQPISVGWRMIPADQRGNLSENTTQRILGNLDGSAGGWTYSANALWSDANVVSKFTDGYLSRSKIIDGLQGANGAPFLNPFGPQSPAGTSYINSTKIIGTVQNVDGSLWGINGNAQRDIFNMAGGAAVLAVGAEYRRENANFTNNFALIRQAASSGLELAQDASGSRNVYAVLAELAMPLMKTMNLNIAVRYDDYSDVGSKVTPKVAWSWQAINNVLLRASYNQGFRAPTLYDLYQPAYLTNTANPYDDPKLCPGGNPVPGADEGRDCQQQFNIRGSGNKNLKPETSDAWSFGTVLDITNSVSVSADYWNTTVKGVITTVPETAIFGDPNKYTSRFIRCSQLSAQDRAEIDACQGVSTGADPLAYIDAPTQNLGNIKAQGVDFSFQGRQATGFGNFSLMMQGTYLLQWKQQLDVGSQYYSALGIYSPELNFPAFRWQHVIMAGWQSGAWGANLFNRLKSGYFDQNQTEAGGGYDDNRVGAYSVWDLTGTWTGIKGLTITAGVLNLFNEKPPFSNQGGTFQVGYDPRFTSPLGRQWLLRGSYEFK